MQKSSSRRIGTHGDLEGKKEESGGGKKYEDLFFGASGSLKKGRVEGKKEGRRISPPYLPLSFLSLSPLCFDPSLS